MKSLEVKIENYANVEVLETSSLKSLTITLTKEYKLKAVIMDKDTNSVEIIFK